MKQKLTAKPSSGLPTPKAHSSPGQPSWGTDEQQSQSATWGFDLQVTLHGSATQRLRGYSQNLDQSSVANIYGERPRLSRGSTEWGISQYGERGIKWRDYRAWELKVHWSPLKHQILGATLTIKPCIFRLQSLLDICKVLADPRGR